MQTTVKNLKKIIVLTNVGAMLFLNVQQSEAQFEYMIGVKGGFAGLHAITPLSAPMGFGAELGFDATYFWSRHWGIGTGVGLAFCNSIIDASGAKSYNIGLHEVTTDYVYDLRTTIVDYRENLHVVMFTVPLMLRYRSHALNSRGRDHQAGGLRWGIGVKLGIPFRAKYSADAFHLKNTGWFTDFGVEVDMPKFGGFGAFDRPEIENSFKIKIACSASAEIGYEWLLGRRLGLYVGAYFDYGLYDIRTEESAPFVVPDPLEPADFKTRQIIVSTDENQQAFVSRLTPISTGLLLKFTFIIHRKKQEKKTKKTIWHFEGHSII